MIPDESYDQDELRPDDDVGIEWLDGEQGDLELSECWRCGKLVDSRHVFCVHCRARLDSAGPQEIALPHETRRTPRGRRDAVATLIYFSLGLFGTSVVFGWLTHFAVAANGPPNGEEVRRSLTLMTIVDVVDAVIVVVAMSRAGRPPLLPPVSATRRTTVWLAMLPTFAALLAANLAYHHWLKDVLRVPQLEDHLTKDPDLLPWVVLTMCVQPAIVEELFFRYLLLGHLRPLVGTHGAVWISAAMFGLFHIFNPLAIPYLILAGVVFAYARVFGRSMALPMLLHFAHNVIVIWFNPWP